MLGVLSSAHPGPAEVRERSQLISLLHASCGRFCAPLQFAGERRGEEREKGRGDASRRLRFARTRDTAVGTGTGRRGGASPHDPHELPRPSQHRLAVAMMLSPFPWARQRRVRGEARGARTSPPRSPFPQQRDSGGFELCPPPPPAPARLVSEASDCCPFNLLTLSRR